MTNGPKKINSPNEINFHTIMDNCEVKTTASDSPISDYYHGKVVLLTGVTGFLGECFLVKLLRYNRTKKSLMTEKASKYL